MAKKALVLTLFAVGAVSLAGIAFARNPSYYGGPLRTNTAPSTTSVASSTVRAEFESRLEQARNAAASRVAQFLGASKEKTAERIFNRIHGVNETLTLNYLRYLDRLDAALNKLASRAEKIKADGKDVSSVESAIDEARQFIAQLRDQVTAQRQKTYTLDIQSREEIKAAFQGALRAMQNDDRRLRNELRAAKERVQDVYRALAAIAGVGAATSTDTGTQQ